MAFTDGTVLFVDPDRPDVLVATELLEPKSGLIEVFREERISAARRLAVGLAQSRKARQKPGRVREFTGGWGRVVRRLRRRTHGGTCQGAAGVLDRPAVVPTPRHPAGRGESGQNPQAP